MARLTLKTSISPSTVRSWMQLVESWSPEERREKERRFVRRIDWHLLPILLIMYIMNYIDRNALPQARIQGLEKDTGMHGVQYNVVLSVTFIGYILAQVPSNMLLGFLRPSWYLAACMAGWGAVSACTGAVFSFGGAAACRFFLGLAEAPFFAGVAFLFSGWYTRKEIGMRLGIFFCGAMLSGAFGGLFSAGIEAAFQHARMASWRYLFIIEGAATVFFALVTGMVIPDWPSTTKWLSEEERALGMMRMYEDAGNEADETKTLVAFKMAMKDYRVWLCILGQFCMQAVASLTNFLPTLVKNFGFNNWQTLLLTAPPYLVTALFCLWSTWYSDRKSNRSNHIVFPTIMTIVGIIITMTTLNIGARYFALFLMLPGTYGCFQISNAWMANISARPRKKRAAALAMNNSIGNIALVWTPYLYPESDGPRYMTAWWTNIALSIVLLISTVMLSIFLRRNNKAMGFDDAEFELSQLPGDGKATARCVEDPNNSSWARYDI